MTQAAHHHEQQQRQQLEEALERLLAGKPEPDDVALVNSFPYPSKRAVQPTREA